MNLAVLSRNPALPASISKELNQALYSHNAIADRTDVKRFSSSALLATAAAVTLSGMCNQAMADTKYYAPTVQDGSIEMYGAGWYQVQDATTYATICEGLSVCETGPGTYIVINLTTGERFENIVVPALVGDTGSDVGSDVGSDTGSDTDADADADSDDDSSEAGVVVDGNILSWPNDGWYQVQSATDFSTVCEGGQSCEVSAGTYIVINHSNGERYENIQVGDSVAGETSTGEAGAITINGLTVSWPADGWYQLQLASDYSTVCQGGLSCDVDPGFYILINHTTGERFEVAVAGLDGDDSTIDDTDEGSDDGLQNYSKTVDVSTYFNVGRYGIPGIGGFDFNGYNSGQSYSTNLTSIFSPDYVEDTFLIDGTDEFVSNPPIIDQYWRRWDVVLGIAEGYLHVVTTINKSNEDVNVTPASVLPPQILDSPDEIWNDDSFEIYFNVGNESTPGYDENDFVRVYRFPTGSESSTSPIATYTGINSQLNLTDEIKCELEEYGARSCEVRFSLEELGIAGRDEAEIGFDIHMNFDDDGGEREAKYSWCSADTVSAWTDMSVVNCSLRIVNDCERFCDGF